MAGLLAGRLALITGAGSGIGRAVCQRFAQEGATVLAVDVAAKSAEETVDKLIPGEHRAFGADVADKGEVSGLVRAVRSMFHQSPSVLVNAAGITRDSLFLNMKEEDFMEVINVNLKGTFLMSQALAAAMLEEQITEGTIVNISSITAKIGNVGQANYTASKAGVEALTKTAAKELAQHKIRVNCIVPGFIDTPMVQSIPDKVKELFLKTVPLRRLGKPEEVADACVFLASPRSSYITGTLVEITGGMAM